MKVKEIQSLARSMNLKTGKLKKAELIHMIQDAEGNNTCYGTSEVNSCGQDNCLWRTDCLKVK
jgi:hypothetical protein